MIKSIILPSRTVEFCRHSSGKIFSALVRMPALILASLVIAYACNAATNEEDTSEYAVKAAFLFKFAEFVEWAPNTFESAASPVVIGIVGDDPFGAVIDKIIQNHKINGRPITILRGQKIEQISGEQILFISQSERVRVAPIASNLAGKNVLTVAEFQDPTVIITFVIEDGKVRFDVNLEQAKHTEVKLSSRLLSVARNVYGK